MQTINIKQIKTSADVLHQLQQLDQALPGSQLSSLTTFNLAYVVVTRSIAEGLAEGYFSDAGLIEDFSVCFAAYYFRAINSMLNDEPDLPEAWRKIISTKATLPYSVLLLMGANAHINHDLPLALLDVMTDKKSAGLVGDLVKIDKLLMKSGREILANYDEGDPALSFIKTHLRWLYYRPTMYIILYWRVVAVYNYKRLQKSTKRSASYTKRSERIASQLAWFGWR